MTESLTIDSSVWLSYFLDSLHKDIIESEQLKFSSSLTLFEVKRQLDQYAQGKRAVEFIENNSIIIDVSAQIAIQATTLKTTGRLSMADAIIATTAIQTDSILITKDSDFQGLVFVKII